MGSMNLAELETTTFLEVLQKYEEVVDPVQWLEGVAEWVEDGVADFDQYTLADTSDFREQFLHRERKLIEECGVLIEDQKRFLKILEWPGRTSSLGLTFLFRTIDRGAFSLYEGAGDVIVLGKEASEPLYLIRGDTAELEIELCEIDDVMSVLGVACDQRTEKRRVARQHFYNAAAKIIKEYKP